MVLLACKPGAGGWDVAAAWTMDAYSAGGLVVQVAEIGSTGQAAAMNDDPGSSYRRLDPDAWCVISHDAVEFADGELSGWTDAGEHTPGSGWLVDLADLNTRIRRADGIWLDSPDVAEVLGHWLAEHGIDDRSPLEAEDDPQEGRWLIPALPWPPTRITFAGYAPLPPGPERTAAVDDLFALTAAIQQDDPPQTPVGLAGYRLDPEGWGLRHDRCGRIIGDPVGADLSALIDAAVTHAPACPAGPLPPPPGATQAEIDAETAAIRATLGGPALDPGAVTQVLSELAGAGADLDALLADEDARAATARTARALEARLGTAGVPTSPDPPHGLPLMDRARYVAAYALRVQATLLAGLANPVFRGHPDGAVSIETASGGVIARLANTGYAKSPTGFAWGGLGSGCAALAKSLLTAALGVQATCPACRGTGRITHLAPDAEEGDGSQRPWQPGDEDTAEQVTVNCIACDAAGIRIPPAAYQAFKERHVATWPEDDGFTITRDELWYWLRHQDTDPDLAAIAQGFPL